MYCYLNSYLQVFNYSKFRKIQSYIWNIIFGFILITAHSQNRLEVLKSFDDFGNSNKTIKEANEAMKLIQNAPILLRTKKEIANNCENRAQFAYLVLNELGFEPINYWVLKESLIEDKYSSSRAIRKSKLLTYNSNKGKVHWGYHVATGIILNVDGNDRIYIYDPWTQKGRLVLLEKWALSFFQESSGRIAYVFPVRGLYKFYGTKLNGKMSYQKSDWIKNEDNGLNQMYCGLSGVTPNRKCSKRRFRNRISKKKSEIFSYLSRYEINID